MSVCHPLGVRPPGRAAAHANHSDTTAPEDIREYDDHRIDDPQDAQERRCQLSIVERARRRDRAPAIGQPPRVSENQYTGRAVAVPAKALGCSPQKHAPTLAALMSAASTNNSGLGDNVAHAVAPEGEHEHHYRRNAATPSGFYSPSIVVCSGGVRSNYVIFIEETRPPLMRGSRDALAAFTWRGADRANRRPELWLVTTRKSAPASVATSAGPNPARRDRHPDREHPERYGAWPSTCRFLLKCGGGVQVIAARRNDGAARTADTGEAGPEYLSARRKSGCASSQARPIAGAVLALVAGAGAGAAAGAPYCERSPKPRLRRANAPSDAARTDATANRG
ncbi:hypothetical protein FQA39_LY19330 [Lamprigera yunnana]|nr:hypothetical protein FQA39_LY19330 [Lamprigera yunnana]